MRRPLTPQTRDSKHFFVILVAGVLVFLICTAVFIMGLFYKSKADRYDKQARYEKSFRPYISNAERALESARQARLVPYEDAISNTHHRVSIHVGWLDQIIRVAPDYPRVHRVRGRLHTFLRDFEGAETDFANYAKLVEGKHQLGAFDHSELTVLRVLRAATLDADAHELEQVGQRSEEEIRAYLDWLKEITQLKLTDAFDLSKLMYARAMLAVFDGRFDEAVEECTIALDFHPGEPAIYDLLAVSHLVAPVFDESDPVEAARKALEQSMEISQFFPETWGLTGIVQLRLNDPVQAERSFRAALSLDKTYTEALVGLARALRAQGRIREGIETLGDAMTGEKALGVEPSWQIRMERGRAHYALHSSETESEEVREKALTDALADLAAAIEMAARNPRARFARALIYIDQGVLDRAAKDLDEVIAEKFDNAEAYQARVRVRIGLKDRAGALQDLDALKRLDDERNLKLGDWIAGFRKQAEALPKN